MTDLDKLEDLLRNDEKERAYELIEEDRGISAEILINEGFYFETIEEHSLSISYFALAEKIAENTEIREVARENLAKAYNNLASVHYRLNRYEDAIKDCNKAIELNPKDAMAYNNRGVAYGELKKHEKTIEDCNKAIELNPNFAMAYNNRGNAYYELNRYEKAIEDCNRAIELNQNLALPYITRGSAYNKLNRYEESIKDYSTAIEFNLKDAAVYKSRGDAYYGLNQYNEAIEDYNKAIKLNPSIDEFYNNRGSVYCKLNRYEKAIEDYNKAIELNPKFAKTYYNRGNAYYGLNWYEESIKDYSTAIELNPKDVAVYNNRGMVYYDLNRYEDAIKDCNRAIELKPKDALAYNVRGATYGELHRYEDAIEDCNKVIELNPNLAAAYINRGISYYRLNRYEDVIEDYTKAIELKPKDAETYNDRGNAYSELNWYEEAIEDYTKAIELSPNLVAAYNNRGLVYHTLNRFEEAIEDYNKVIELNPNLAHPYKNRGITRLETNEDLNVAIADFKQARDIFKGKDKERMLGFIAWTKARKEMNIKNWDAVRERMNEAREIFEKNDEPLSHSLDAFIKFSYLDEELDNALNISDPIEASERIEKALKNLPEIERLIDPERTIFIARISSFAILGEFIGSMRTIDENTDLGVVKAKLTKLLEASKEVEELFESVNFDTGKTTIVNLQRIISSIKEEIGIIEDAPNKNRKALEILKNYWFRLSSAIKVMNGISTRESENITLIREMREMKSQMRVGFAGTKKIILERFKKSSEEHKEILEIIYETKNILLQKDVVNARYRIEIQAPLISSLSPISPKIIVDIPMGNLTDAQMEEKAEEITDKIKDLSGKAKKEFLEAIKRIPEIGKKLLKRLEKTKG